MEKKYISVDLHAHSTYSDGSLSVAELMSLVKQNKGKYQALTDHDTVTGIAEARKEATANGLILIPGVEISVTWTGNSLVHIIGLGVDEQNSQLVESLDMLRNQRLERGKKIAQKLAHAGIGGAFEGAMSFCKNPESLSRTHFSDWLVANEYAKPGKAFPKFLAPGKVAYVAQQWASLDNAVKWITESGGIAVIAHPARYQFTRTKLVKLIDEFKAYGGIGIELISSSHSLQDEANIASLCINKGLCASIGSDFHKIETYRRINPGVNKASPNGIPTVFKYLGIDENNLNIEPI
jgi:predicted metal-dependent phosphoesterase TrpH